MSNVGIVLNIPRTVRCDLCVHGNFVVRGYCLWWDDARYIYRGFRGCITTANGRISSIVRHPISANLRCNKITTPIPPQGRHKGPACLSVSKGRSIRRRGSTQSRGNRCSVPGVVEINPGACRKCCRLVSTVSSLSSGISRKRALGDGDLHHLCGGRTPKSNDIG